MAPIRTAGTFGRNLVSIRKNDLVLDFTMTFPDPKNRKVFYVTNLKDMSVHKIEIGEDGREIFNKDHNLKSEVGCDTTIFTLCSSGQHSFENMHTVSDCEYWNNPGAGTPPSVFTIPGSCDGGSTGGAGGGGGPSGGGDPTGGGGSGGGGTTVPPGGTTLPPLTHSDCVEYLDCEDCNLPGDLNDDCQLTWDESLLMDLSLGRNEKNWFTTTALLSQKQLIGQYYWNHSKSNEARNFIIESIRAWMAGGKVDFEEEVILDKSFIDNNCLYGVYTAMGKAPTFNGYLQNFDTDMSMVNLRFGYDVNFEVNYPIQTSAIAITNSPENYLIKIDFNGDPNLSSSIHGKPKLIVATSFIHEIIHAEMYRKMLVVAQQPDLNFTQWYIQDPYSFENFKAELKFNFFGIWDYYTRYEWNVPPGQEPSSPQHQQMAENYRNTIISAISEYDNYQHLPSFYEALSWYGLMGTGDYDPTTGLYEKSTGAWEHIDENPNLTAAQERMNIRNTIINFQNNDTNTCN